MPRTCSPCPRNVNGDAVGEVVGGSCRDVGAAVGAVVGLMQSLWPTSDHHGTNGTALLPPLLRSPLTLACSFTWCGVPSA
jgi:hypothetical protein